jgi:hypothetical protein
MNKRIFLVAVLALPLTTLDSPVFAQMSSEVKNLLSQRIGLSQDQTSAVQRGQPFAKNMKPRTPAEIFVFGVIYVNVAPENYMRLERDVNRVRRGRLYGTITKFNDPPQLSDLRGFGFDSDDVKGLKDCKPGHCTVQMPASATMDDFRKSVNWTAPNVDEEVNQFVQKLALSRVQQYQKEGNSIFGKVYNEKGKQVNVSDQFKYILSYYQALPRGLPELYKYILDYPNAKPANVENSFYWEKMNFGLKPTLRIVHVLTMQGNKPDQPLYVIAEKQLYASHYFETGLGPYFFASRQ